jgi:hypothetical protein
MLHIVSGNSGKIPEHAVVVTESANGKNGHFKVETLPRISCIQ